MKKTYTNTKTFMEGRNIMDFRLNKQLTNEEEKALEKVAMSNKDAFNAELKDFVIATFKIIGFDTSFINSPEFDQTYTELIGDNNYMIQDLAYAYVVNDKYKDYFEECRQAFIILLCGGERQIEQINSMPTENKILFFVQCMSFLYYQNTHNKIDCLNTLSNLFYSAEEDYIRGRALMFGIALWTVGMDMNYLKGYVAKMGF